MKQAIARADGFAEPVRLLRAEQWDDGIASFDACVASGASPDATARLLRSIARIRSRDVTHGLAGLDAATIAEANGRNDVRRYLVGPFVRERRFADAQQALERLIVARVDTIEDHRLLVNVLARRQDWSAAKAAVDAAALRSPADTTLQALRIQIRLQAGAVAEAAALSRALKTPVVDPALAQMAMTALLRAGAATAAADIAQTLPVAGIRDERAVATAVQALLADGRAPHAVELGATALSAGLEGAGLRLQLARASLAQRHHIGGDREARAHLAAGLRQAPGDPRLCGLQGELLLRAGRFGEAAPLLEQASTANAQLEQPRALYARALKHLGRHQEAAEQFLHLLDAAPERDRWQRNAASALIQAGRVDEAQKLFDRFVARRSRALPSSVGQGLDALWDRVDQVVLPAARLDWAWSLRRVGDAGERSAWERAARWGHLADHFLLDWLECRDDRAEQVMALLGDLDAVEAVLARFAAPGQGVVFATAHVGMLYAGPIALELLGRPYRWLASTPRVARSSYGDTLLSTSSQSEPQIARAALGALRRGDVIALAVDGAASPAAPRVAFEGQSVTYSSFAARAAFRTGALSIFSSSRWHEGQIVLNLERLPAPAPDEDIDAYAARWREAYFCHLRTALSDSPENLRLSGGIWRHVA